MAVKLELDDSSDLLELGLAPGEDHPELRKWLAKRGRLLGKGSTRLVMEHRNPNYVSKCAYTDIADRILALGGAGFGGVMSNHFEAKSAKLLRKLTGVFPHVRSSEMNGYSCIVLKKLTPIDQLTLDENSELYIQGDKVAMVKSRFVKTYTAVVVAAMEEHLENAGILLNDIDASGIGVDDKGNLYIIDWGNGFSYGNVSITPDKIDSLQLLQQQQGGDVSYLHGDAYDMLYDDEFNRRYIISQPSPPYVCFFERKSKKATVFDTKTGRQDSAMTAYAQKLADGLLWYFLNKMEEKNITVVYRVNSRGCYKFNSDDIAGRLMAMNAILQARCPEIRLVFGYSKDLPGELTTYADGLDALTLCLYIGERCISSIMLTHTLDDSLDINSRTHDSFQGRGYNKLVRAAIIMVCALMICSGHRFKYIRSIAENPVSAHTLIKEFDVEITTPGVELTGDKNTDLAMVKSYYMTPGAYLSIKVDIEKNVQRATVLFDELTAKLRCF